MRPVFPVSRAAAPDHGPAQLIPPRPQSGISCGGGLLVARMLKNCGMPTHKESTRVKWQSRCSGLVFVLQLEPSGRFPASCWNVKGHNIGAHDEHVALFPRLHLQHEHMGHHRCNEWPEERADAGRCPRRSRWRLDSVAVMRWDYLRAVMHRRRSLRDAQPQILTPSTPTCARWESAAASLLPVSHQVMSFCLHVSIVRRPRFSTDSPTCCWIPKPFVSWLD